MKQFDFDNVPDRRGTSSCKWDSAPNDDIIPLWVADMDFPAAPCIIDALRRRVEHGVFGYVKVPDSYYKAVTDWFRKYHSWNINRDMIIYTTGVVPALSAIVKALARPGEGVIIQSPVYNCFFSSIRNNGCQIIDNPLKRVETPDGFSYEMDFDDLRSKAAMPSAKVMLLCNPHNPAGRMWSHEELTKVAEICRENGVTVVSDEIHCEFAMPGYEYTPYATVDSNAVICCSPSKAFNVAGLQTANIVCPDTETRGLIDKAININEICDINPFGVVALQAAYNEGHSWIVSLCDYIHGNYRMLHEFFASELPELKVCKLEATYLAWIDIAPLGISSKDLEKLALDKFKVWINPGDMYGQEGYIRINMACPRKRLEEGLLRLKQTVESLTIS